MVLVAPEKPLSFDDPKNRMARLESHFKKFPRVLEIISTLQPHDLQPTDIAFVQTDQLMNGRVVLIGDAAHAMEPFAGIGASMAMEDAYVLSEEIAQIAFQRNLQKALNRYVNRRLPRVQQARAQTREMYWWVTSPLPCMPHIRNILSKVAPISHFTKGYKQLLAVRP